MVHSLTGHNQDFEGCTRVVMLIITTRADELSEVLNMPSPPSAASRSATNRRILEVLFRQGMIVSEILEAISCKRYHSHVLPFGGRRSRHRQAEALSLI